MAFTYTNSRGISYILHAKNTTLKNGRQQIIYYFAKSEKDGALDAVPKGYQVNETRSGLPVLKRIPGQN